MNRVIWLYLKLVVPLHPMERVMLIVVMVMLWVQMAKLVLMHVAAIVVLEDMHVIVVLQAKASKESSTSYVCIGAFVCSQIRILTISY